MNSPSSAMPQVMRTSEVHGAAWGSTCTMQGMGWLDLYVVMLNDRTPTASALLAEEIIEALLPRLRAELAALVPTEPPAPPEPELRVADTETVARLLNRSKGWVRDRREALGGWKPPGSKSYYFDVEKVEQYVRDARHVTDGMNR